MPGRASRHAHRQLTATSTSSSHPVVRDCLCLAGHLLLLRGDDDLVHLLDRGVVVLRVRLLAIAQRDALRLRGPPLVALRGDEGVEVVLHALALLEARDLVGVLDAQVLGLVALGEIAEILAHVALLLLGEQRRWPRAPHELVELVLEVAPEELALGGPEAVAVLRLVPPVGHARGHVAARGVPLDVRAHEVLVLPHGLLLVAVVPLELPAELVEAREEEHLPLGRPVERVGRPPLELGDEAHLGRALGRLHGVDADVVLGALARDERKAHALGLPGKGDDAGLLGLKLEHLDCHVAVPYAEELEGGVDGLLGLGVPVHLDSEEVALWVPAEPDVVEVEQVLLADLLPGRHLDDRHARRRVAELRHPVSDTVVRRAPRKVADAVHAHGHALLALVLPDELHGARLVAVDAVFAEPREVLAIVRPPEDGPAHLVELLWAREGPELGARGYVPHDDALRLLGHGAPRDDEPLAGREVEELDPLVAVLHQLLP
mmetsp:Transcript_18275/g.61121  ORF Transcript_18275/g.61121 Transcript_18275/m.61121 type:complete len:490 (+) Transcript_18275:43-1512(+)